MTFADGGGSMLETIRAQSASLAERLVRRARVQQRSLREIMLLADRVNEYDAHKPWDPKDPPSNEPHDGVHGLVNGLPLLTIRYLAPCCRPGRAGGKLPGQSMTPGMGWCRRPTSTWQRHAADRRVQEAPCPSTPCARSPFSRPAQGRPERPGGEALARPITIDDFAKVGPAHRQDRGRTVEGLTKCCA